MDLAIFKKLGFSDKDTQIYLTLVALGPSSVRVLAKKSEMNRGSVYESLKWLREKELVSLFEKELHQYFVAEDPEKLYKMVREKMSSLNEIEKDLKDAVLELKSLHDQGSKKPVARYYEKGGVKVILEDVLSTCEKQDIKEYRVYSDPAICEFLYNGFETFSDARVAKGIQVKVIALGRTGELRGLDQRKFLKKKNIVPTYKIVYPGKTAYISLDNQGELVGVVVENEGIFETEKNIFDELWEKL